ncbi:MAG: hypothetical protein ACI4SK_01350, partial [Christensenellales bacterium]
MYLKAKLLKAAAICNYVFSALWFIVTAGFFALSNNLYWMFLAFALTTLYVGFVIASVKDRMTSVELTKKENIKLLVCWILSILSPASFVLCAIAYFRKTEDQPTERKKVVKEKTREAVSAPATKKEKVKA